METKWKLNVCKKTWKLKKGRGISENDHSTKKEKNSENDYIFVINL